MREWLRELRNWTVQLPSGWGLGQSKIHSSLLLTLAILSGLFLMVGATRPSARDLLPVALTLPIVWVGSLAVRLAAQQLAVGGYSHELDIIVGPTGNLQTDYEYLPANATLSYSVCGQLASIGLASLGLSVHAAMLPGGAPSSVSLPHLLTFHGGWDSQSWATQILWVNVFLFCLHLLPTIPFDMRATMFALFSMRNRTAQEPQVFRAMASLDSHFAAVMMGIGLAAVGFGWVLQQPIAGWYAAIAAAVYLFVASRWESARAEELEEQYQPRALRRPKSPLRAAGSGAPTPSHGESVDEEPDWRTIYYDDAPSDAPPATDPREASGGESAEPTTPIGLDIDEILRKIHREGRDALTEEERQALLDASRRIQARRGTASN